jgi:hypothetical protein
MSELKLHSSGENDHIQSLKEKYSSLKDKIMQTLNFSKNEKNKELENLNESFEKEKRNSKNNLY